MRFRRTLALVVLFVGTAFAQTPADELKSKIGNVYYPRLAEAARVQGDVHLRLNSGVVAILSGPPLLVRTAVESAKLFASLLGEGNVDVTYHFAFVNSAVGQPTPMTVKRGNAFKRAVLRMFGFKTEKVVLDYRCKDVAAPPSDLKISGTTIEIWIYGRNFCVQTQAATLTARR